MLKFVVVLYRRADLGLAEFRNYFRTVHGPMAEQIPGLRGYVQNVAIDDPHRAPPEWDAVVELCFDDRNAMEAAWASPQGEAATADLERFADLSRTSWSVVEERRIR